MVMFMKNLLHAAQTLRGVLQTPLLAERVSTILEELILSGDVKPGSRIIEEDLARELGISRGPLREAMLSLERTGLITRRGRNGRIISILTPEDVVELYEFWTILECSAVTIACRKADASDYAELERLLDEVDRSADHATIYHLNRNFHEALITPCGNRRLLEVYQNVSKQVRWAWCLKIVKVGQTEQSQREHKEIYAAFRARDEDRVESLLRIHLGAGMQKMIRTAEANAP